MTDGAWMSIINGQSRERDRVHKTKKKKPTTLDNTNSKKICTNY